MEEMRAKNEVYISATFDEKTGNAVQGGLFDENIFGKKDTWLPYCEGFGNSPNFLPKKMIGNFGKIVLPAIFRCFADKQNKIDEILVLPPVFRPMKKLENESWATSDLNYLYRKIIVRSERMKRMLALSDTPLGVIEVECVLLQEAVEALRTELKRLFAENPNANEKVRRAIEKCLGEKRKKPDKQELYKKALRLAVEEGQISLSIFQRKLSIGYNLAGELVEKMEREGLVEPFIGAKLRRVLITKEQYGELYGEEL